MTSIATNPALGDVYAYWRSRRRRGLLPLRKEVDVAHLRPAEGRLQLVSVLASHRDAYHFLVGGSPVEHDCSGNDIDPHGSALFSPLSREDLAEYLLLVAWLGTPRCQNVVERLLPITHRYSRLLLPLSEDGRRVTMLAICTSGHAFSDPRRAARVGCLLRDLVRSGFHGRGWEEGNLSAEGRSGHA
jgi:hypothetical protein